MGYILNRILEIFGWLFPMLLGLFFWYAFRFALIYGLDPYVHEARTQTPKRETLAQ